MYHYIKKRGIIMKRPRINLIIGKKHLIIAGLALVLSVGLYANFALADNVQTVDNKTENYGDVTFVSSQQGSADKNTDTTEDIKETAADEYFAKARIDKKNSRAEATEVLKSIYNGGDLTKDEMQVVAQDTMKMTELMEAETKIETVLKAQGFEDVLCYLSGTSANIIVKTPSLDTAGAAKIKDALLSEVELTSDNITIVEVN
ncbi:MAG: SpoIIIAH-like family protein [Ruminiclostridium sp.]|nr:SpoIIIAH-like family protein [Ruminiclostridium sp.]